MNYPGQGEARIARQ